MFEDDESLLMAASRIAEEMGEIERLRAQLTAAHARIAELEEDGKRLDWLDMSYSGIHCNFTFPEAWTVTTTSFHGTDDKEYHGETLRKAIDAARSRRGER